MILSFYDLLTEISMKDLDVHFISLFPSLKVNKQINKRQKQYMREYQLVLKAHIGCEEEILSLPWCGFWSGYLQLRQAGLCSIFFARSYGCEQGISCLFSFSRTYTAFHFLFLIIS